MRKILLLVFLLFSISYSSHAQTQYTWILATGGLDEPGNWYPARDNPLPDDILIFDGSNSSIVYITNFSPREVIGQMVFLNNCSATFQTGSSILGPGSVSWSGSTVNGVGTSFLTDFVPGDLININGTVVEVASVTSSNRLTTTTTGSATSGSSYGEYARLTMTGGTNAFYIDNSSSVTINANSPISFYTAAGTTGDIEGSLNFSTNQHRLNSASAAAFTFGATGKFTQSNGFIGNAFTAAGVPNAVTFTNGSTFTMSAGLSPFGLATPASKVVFQTGSLFKQTSGTPVFDGRKYGNFELSVNGNITVTGSNAVSVGNIVLSGTSTTFNWGMTGNPGHVIKGNITVGTGCTFNFFPAGNATPGTVTFAGSSLQTISTPSTISPITINSYATIINGNPAGIALAPGTMIKIVAASNITFDLNNNPLTLKSNVNGTAGIGSFDGSQSNYLLNATNVTVERYIPVHAARVYTLVASPVNSPSIYNSWQEAGAATAGYGTQISGSGTGNGFDFASASGTASIFAYNDNNPTGSKWVGLANTNNTNLGTGTGYLLFVRGDRTVGAGSGVPRATTLRAHGSLTVGDVTFATNGGTPGTPNLISGANKYNLIANPFACAFAWSTASITTANLSGSYTVYDPNLQVFVTSDGSTKSPNVGQQQANIIQPGQAFFIQNDASGNDPEFILKESDKVTSFNTRTSNTVFRGASSIAQLNMNIYHGSAAQPAGFADGAVAIFSKAYSAGIGEEDAAKFTNFNETIGWMRDGKILSIEGRPLKTTNDTLYCNMKSMKQGIYSFSIDASGFTNAATATLIDGYTGTRQPLDLTQLNSYDFTINTDAGSSVADRFMIVLGRNSPLIITPAVQVKLAPNPFRNQLTVSFNIPGAATKTIRLLNSLGQVVKTQAIGNDETGTATVPTGRLLSGIYIVEVWSGESKVFTQQLVK